MRIYSLSILFIVLFSSLASAQTASSGPSWTFGGTAGYGRTWDDEGSIGSGWVVGGYADRRLAKHLDIEFAADLVKNTRSDTFVADGKTTYVSAAVIRRFGSRRTNGFLMGGAAISFFNGETGFSDGSFRNRRSSTNPGWIFGGGLSFRTAGDIEVAPILRMTLMRIENDSDPWSSITYGIRVGFNAR